MPSFAFWNVSRKNLTNELVTLVAENDLDFLMLCESASDPFSLVGVLNRNVRDQYLFIQSPAGTDRFQVFTRLRPDLATVRHEGSRFLILKIRIPGIPAFNLMVLHAPSPASFWSDDSISHALLEMARELQHVEKTDQSPHSVVVGDFNQNPFSPGLCSALGFHAIMEAREAKKGSRRILETQRDYFYNPMWSFLGDLTQYTPGTHYHRGAGMIEYQWQMIDQVIVRPSLLDYFNPATLRIIDQIGSQSLLTPKYGRPHKQQFSDHLPLYFELNP